MCIRDSVNSHVKNKKNHITIIHNNYLKNLREELLEEEEGNLNKNNNEIIYITAGINSVDVYKRQEYYCNVRVICNLRLCLLFNDCVISYLRAVVVKYGSHML